MYRNPRLKQSIAASLTACWMMAALPSLAYAEPASHGKEGEQGDAGELAEGPGFLHMPLLNIPVLKNNRVSGRLMVDMVLDAASAEAIQEIAKNRTLLSAGYTAALGAWAASFQDAYAPANVVAIKNQLQNVTNETLGRTDVVVLLQSAMLRR